MRAIFAVLVFLFAGCKGTDLAPDEFHLGYARGWADNNFDHRNVDFATDSDTVAIGFTWHLGESASERERERQFDLMTRTMSLLADEQARAAEDRKRAAEERAAAPTAPVIAPGPTIITVPTPIGPTAPSEPAKSPEASTAAPDADKPKEVVLTDIIGDAKEYLLYSLGALALAVAAFIKRKTIVEAAVTVKRRVQERGKDREAVKRRLQEGAPKKDG